MSRINRDHKTWRHATAIHPILDGHQVSCSCGFLSDTYTTYPEAWLAAAIHRRNAPRTGGKTRDPRWILARRPE